MYVKRLFIFQILNFLHRGPVTFSTLVYDTNVGDISALATYFNPERISERELNLRSVFFFHLQQSFVIATFVKCSFTVPCCRFGHYPATGGDAHPASPAKQGGQGDTAAVVRPRLLLYPDHASAVNQDQVVHSAVHSGITKCCR